MAPACIDFAIPGAIMFHIGTVDIWKGLLYELFRNINRIYGASTNCSSRKKRVQKGQFPENPKRTAKKAVTKREIRSEE